MVRNVVKADVASLYPSLMLTYKIGPRSDQHGAFLGLLRELTTLRLQHKAETRRHPPGSHEAHAHEAASGAMKQLINSFYGSLGHELRAVRRSGGGRRGDAPGPRGAGPDADRARAARRAADRGGHGRRAVQRATDWTEADERRLIDEVSEVLPDGISVEHDGRYAAMYSYAEKNYALQSVRR